MVQKDIFVKVVRSTRLGRHKLGSCCAHCYYSANGFRPSWPMKKGNTGVYNLSMYLLINVSMRSLKGKGRKN